MSETQSVENYVMPSGPSRTLWCRKAPGSSASSEATEPRPSTPCLGRRSPRDACTISFAMFQLALVTARRCFCSPVHMPIPGKRQPRTPSAAPWQRQASAAAFLLCCCMGSQAMATSALQQRPPRSSSSIAAFRMPPHRPSPTSGGGGGDNAGSPSSTSHPGVQASRSSSTERWVWRVGGGG
jgi:hypothetical protein